MDLSYDWFEKWILIFKSTANTNISFLRFSSAWSKLEILFFSVCYSATASVRSSDTCIYPSKVFIIQLFQNTTKLFDLEYIVVEWFIRVFGRTIWWNFRMADRRQSVHNRCKNFLGIGCWAMMAICHSLAACFSTGPIFLTRVTAATLPCWYNTKCI